jgi:hypothetical protein
MITAADYSAALFFAYSGADIDTWLNEYFIENISRADQMRDS